MSLFRNTRDLKLFADIHKQTDWDTLLPYVQQAENDYIIPLIGEEQFEYFNSAIKAQNDTEANFNFIFQDVTENKLFKLLATALANFALYEAFPFLNTSLGDIGVQQQSSKEGTSAPAAQWRYESRRSAHLNTGDSYIEKTLEFLEKNAASFPLWSNSEYFTINKDLLIGDSAMLTTYLGMNDSRRAFIAIRPYIRLAEKDIIAILGKPLFDSIKEEGATLPSTIPNKILLEGAREAVAWTAYYYALPFLSIRINGDGVQVVSKNDSINQRSSASKDDKETARAQAGRFSDKFLNTLRQFMDINIDEYPLYKTYMADKYVVTSYQRKVNRRGSGHFST